MNDPTTFSVVVPTYRRPDVLVGCLRALHAQQLTPCEVLVCRRSNDQLTADGLADLPDAEKHLVREVVIGPDDNFAKALQAGISASSGDLVALTDDDAEAPTDWLAKLADAFSDPTVGACGGRDILPDATEPKSKVVGKLQWFGRLIGAHHDGVGPARDVDVLKGVNCSFRGDLIRMVGIDPRLIGAGNVVHTELSMCLPIRRAGYRIVYDPSITVIHHVAPRTDDEKAQRTVFIAAPYADAVHNETLQVLDHLTPGGRLAFVTWATLIGTAVTPGLLQTPRSALRSGSLLEAGQRLFGQVRARLKAVKTSMTSRPDEGILTP